MRSLRSIIFFASALTFSGCGYVHFGRLPAERTGDAALQRAYADLTLEHKILRQELVLVRKETETLRAAVERSAAGDTPGNSQAVQQLEQTTRELSTLRTNLAVLEAERISSTTKPLTAAEPRAAVLQDENARLQRELEEARRDNASLAERLQSSIAATELLNTDLLAQKQARERAEQATLALRAQLEAVMARAGRAESATASPAQVPVAPTAAQATGTASLAGLQSAKAPPSDAVPTAELRTSLARIRSMPPAAAPLQALAAPAGDSKRGTAQIPAQPSMRHYTVRAGDTLEKISLRFFGAADQWGKIYAANNEVLSSSNGLKPGTELQIPGN